MPDIKLLKPTDFISMPWRNGLGTTIELIKQDLENAPGFRWRLSMADVTEDGPFSDFTGYDRTLVLLEGNGVDLVDGTGRNYSLVQPLDFARFRGEDKICATLHDGPIRDFNIMTSRQHCTARVQTSTERGPVNLDIEADLIFLYAVDSDLNCKTELSETQSIPARHLLVMDQTESRTMLIQGGPFIVIQIGMHQ